MDGDEPEWRLVRLSEVNSQGSQYPNNNIVTSRVRSIYTVRIINEKLSF
jgi:hypothetical protein